MDLIKKRVNLLMKNHDTNCPFTIAKSRDIQIQYELLGNTLGYYSKHFRIPIIHINESINEKMQKFVCAHELGHAILHPNTNTQFLKKHTFFSTDRIELEANTFALELLFSKEVTSTITIQEAIEEYGIPKQLATLVRAD